jgi:hypothetical protein
MIPRGPLCLLRRRRLSENRNFDERVIRMHSSLTRNREYEILAGNYDGPDLAGRDPIHEALLAGPRSSLS